MLVDGAAVDDSTFTTFANPGSSGMTNIAFADGASLGAFSTPQVGSTMATDIYIGGRMDENAVRHFIGGIAGVVISDETACEATVSDWHD